MAIEVWEWISNFTPHFAGHAITCLKINDRDMYEWMTKVSMYDIYIIL